MFQKLILCYAYLIINVPLKSGFHPGDSCMYPTLAIPPCNMVTTGKSRILAAFIIPGEEQLKSENHSLELFHAPTCFQTQEPREQEAHSGTYRSVNNFRKMYEEGSRYLVNVLEDIAD